MTFCCFYRENDKQRQCKLFQEIVMSKKKAMASASGNDDQANESFTSVAKEEEEMDNKGSGNFEYKVAKRYFSELNVIRKEAGEEGDSSEDENYPGNISPLC